MWFPSSRNQLWRWFRPFPQLHQEPFCRTRLPPLRDPWEGLWHHSVDQHLLVFHGGKIKQPLHKTTQFFSRESCIPFTWKLGRSNARIIPNNDIDWATTDRDRASRTFPVREGGESAKRLTHTHARKRQEKQGWNSFHGCRLSMWAKLFERSEEDASKEEAKD